MIHHLARFVPAVVLVALAAGTVGAARQSSTQPPAYRAGVDLVTVDVTVLTRDGDPIVTLGPDDFTVSVDGQPRRVVTMRLVRAASAAVPTQAPPPGTPPATPAAVPASEAARRFVLVVDRDHLPIGEGQQMLDAGARFIDKLPAADRVAVWTIPSTATSIQFLPDREVLKRRLREAVGTYRPPLAFWNIARDEAIAIDDGDKKMLDMVINRECNGQPQYCPGGVVAEASTLAITTRERATATLRGLENLIDALGRLEGPSQLVLITTGPLWARNDQAYVSSIGARAADARVTLHALQVAEPPYQARTDQMRATTMEINQSASASFALAGITGGLAITASAGDVAFNTLTRELSAGYVLAIETGPSDRDGQLHEIKVEVRDRGWGVAVRARRSFRIDPTAAAPAATPPPPEAAPPAPAPTTPPAPATEPTSATSPLGTDVGNLASRLAAYAEQFEQALSSMVAEERYVQIIHPWRGNPKGPESEPALAWQEPSGSPPPKKGGPIIARRQLLSDVLLVQVKGQQWFGYRDVAEVDGRPVRDRTERVRELFLSRAADRDSQFWRIAEESARYNLGDIRRTLNMPMVTLSFMRRTDQWRFVFRRLADEQVAGETARVISFKEKTRPTLIRTSGGSDIPIEGRIWLDGQHGRVVRTELRFDRGSERRCLIRVDYRPQAPIDVLVPAQMWEWYEGVNQTGRIGGDKTLVQSVATYGNIRQFQVTTSERIK